MLNACRLCPAQNIGDINIIVFDMSTSKLKIKTLSSILPEPQNIPTIKKNKLLKEHMNAVEADDQRRIRRIFSQIQTV